MRRGNKYFFPCTENMLHAFMTATGSLRQTNVLSYITIMKTRGLVDGRFNQTRLHTEQASTGNPFIPTELSDRGNRFSEFLH